MNVFVTGGAGYIGSVCVEELIHAGHHVTAYDNLSEGHRSAVDKRAVFVHGDVSVKAVSADDASKSAWRVIIDGAGPHTIGVGGALDAVEIRPGADVTLSASGGVADLLLEGALSTPTPLDVGTLHVRRLPPHPIDGAVHATFCDLPHDVVVDLGAGVTCDQLK